MSKRKLMVLLRKAEGLSMRGLAKKMKVSAAHVCRVEGGSQRPTLTYLEKFGKVMHMPPVLLVHDRKRDGERIFRTLEKILAGILKARVKMRK